MYPRSRIDATPAVELCSESTECRIANCSKKSEMSETSGIFPYGFRRFYELTGLLVVVRCTPIKSHTLHRSYHYTNTRNLCTTVIYRDITGWFSFLFSGAEHGADDIVKSLASVMYCVSVNLAITGVALCPSSSPHLCLFPPYLLHCQQLRRRRCGDACFAVTILANFAYSALLQYAKTATCSIMRAKRVKGLDDGIM